MASDRFQELRTRLTATSKAFSDAATHLSGQIHSFEGYLHSLPGKTRVDVKTADLGILSFRRHEGTWRLVVGDGGIRVTRLAVASSEAKVKATALFEPLLIELVRKQEELAESSTEAAKTVSALLEKLGVPRGEGK